MCIRDQGPAGDSKAPKRSSNSGRYAATKTSTPTGSTTWPKNAAESTSPDTPIASSRKRPDVPPREPHPNELSIALRHAPSSFPDALVPPPHAVHGPRCPPTYQETVLPSSLSSPRRFLMTH